MYKKLIFYKRLAWTRWTCHQKTCNLQNITDKMPLVSWKKEKINEVQRYGKYDGWLYIDCLLNKYETLSHILFID